MHYGYALELAIDEYSARMIMFLHTDTPFLPQISNNILGSYFEKEFELDINSGDEEDKRYALHMLKELYDHKGIGTCWGKIAKIKEFTVTGFKTIFYNYNFDRDDKIIIIKEDRFIEASSVLFLQDAFDPFLCRNIESLFC